MQEVTRDMPSLSTGSVRERRHCLSVRFSIVSLTQNDSVDLARTFSPTLPSPMSTNAWQSYVNVCRICQRKTEQKNPLPCLSALRVSLIFQVLWYPVSNDKRHSSEASRCHSKLSTNNTVLNLSQYDRPGRIRHKLFASKCSLSGEIQQYLHQNCADSSNQALFSSKRDEGVRLAICTQTCEPSF